MNRFLGLLILTVFSLSNSNGQCGSTVDAGPDLLLCPDDGGIQLSAQVGGNAFDFEWEGHATLDNPLSLTPTVSPNVTTEYTLAVFSVDPADNLVINGDFEQGNTGFFSEYDFSPGGQAGPITPGGSYDITTNSNDSHSTFNACTDNSGSGNMMACNGSTQQNVKVWCQTIAVVPSETYVLRAFIASIWDIGAAELQFSINDDLVGDIFLPELNPPCTYDFFDERWTSSPGETTAEICVVNQTTIFVGYNFSLDDIFFAPVCVQYDQVTVEVPELELELDEEFALPCLWDNETFILAPGGVPYTDTEYSYSWSTTDGSIVSGSNQTQITAQAEGTYTLTLNYDNGNGTCSTERSVAVARSQNQPVVDLTGPPTLNCDFPSITISSLNSFVPAGSVFDWQTTDGNIITAADGPDITVIADGTYSLTITSPDGCFATETFTVDADFSETTPLVAPPEELSCILPEITLNGSATLLGPDDLIVWESSDGSFSGGEETLMPTVTSPGTYTLFVINDRTGCVNELDVVVSGSTGSAVAAIAEPPVMDCVGTPIMLVAEAASTGGGVTYAWSSPDGQIDGPSDATSLTVSAPGTYTFRVTLPNGCFAIDSQSVTQVNFTADIEIFPTDQLTCTRDTVALMATVATDVVVEYAWNSPDGNISSGTNSLSPSVSSSGSYQLVVTEQATGCRQIANVTVTADTTRPVANAGPDRSITCLTPDVLLTSLGGDSRSTAAWSTPDGNNVPALTNTPGLFLLTVTDTINGCSALDSIAVVMDTISPAVTLSTPFTELTCSRQEIVLGQLVPVSNLSFQWSGPQGTVNAPLITATTDGSYTLRTTNIGNGCTDVDNVVLTANTEQPQFAIVQPEILNCEFPQRQLSAAVTNPDGFDPLWTTNGNITAGATGLSPTINAPGSYQLLLRNPETGCADSLSVDVLQDTLAPSVLIAQAPVLTCSRANFLLDASGTTSGDSIAYAWSTNGGNFTETPTGLTPLIDAAGSYQLLATNTLNGCAAAATVSVAVDTVRPVATTVQSAPALTCLVPSVGLGVLATEPDIMALWTGPGVNATSRQINVTAPGTYSILLIDPDNGCRDSTTVMLPAFQELPVLDIALPPVLTCATPSVALEATVANPEDVEIFWSGTGEVIAGTDALRPTVTQAGIYQLLLVNPATGCSDSLRVSVVQNITTPEATIAVPVELTCEQPVLQLNAGGSTQGDSISYAWTSIDGNFVSGEASALPFVNAAGTYQLVVRNTINGCFESTDVTVLDNTDRPDVELGENRVLNCIDTTQLLASLLPSGANLTSRWSSADGSVMNVAQPSLEVSAPGTYYLTLSNPDNGCFTSDSLVVIRDVDMPVAEITGPVRLTCTTPTVTLLGQDATSGHPTDYRWLSVDGNGITDATQAEINLESPGTYQLILTYPHNGCRDTADMTVEIDTLSPAVALPALPMLNCRDTTAILSAEVAGNTEVFDYRWFRDGTVISEPSLGQQITVTEPGRYRLVVTDEANGCINMVEGLVEEDVLTPVIVPLEDVVLTCRAPNLSTSVALLSGRPEVNYSWSTNDGALTGAITNADLSVSAPGTYSVRVIDRQNNCFAVADWHVGQDIVEPTANLLAELDLGCDPVPVSVSADVPTNNNYQFAWTTTGGEILSEVNQPGIDLMGEGSYQIRVTDPANGCSTSLELLATQMFLEGFTTTLSPPNCQRPSGAINFDAIDGGIGPFLYSIDGGSSYLPSTNFAGLPPGRYDIGVQDVRGCETMNSIDVPTARALELSVDDDLYVRHGDSVRLQLLTNFAPEEIDTIVWAPASGFNCSGCPNPVVRPLASTNFQVTVTTTDGCVASERVSVFVNEELAVYFPTGFSPNGDGINDFWLPLADTSRVPLVRSLVIYDRWGSQVFNAENISPEGNNSGWDGRSRGRFLNPGVFIWSAVIVRFDGQVDQVSGQLVLSR